MLKSSGKLTESKKKDLTKTLTFSISPNLKTSSSINVFKMVCDGKITQLHEHIHNLTLEAKRNKKTENDILEEISTLLNLQDSQGKTLLFYAM